MDKYILKYDSPAAANHQGWEQEALPIGNGYQGMKVFGRTDTERLQFNEKTLWQGGPSDKRPNYNGGNLTNKNEALLNIQKALINKNNKQVNHIKNELIGIEDGYGSYQSFGNMYLVFNHSNITNFERGLDISDGYAYVKYNSNGINYLRKHYANYIDRCLISELTTDTANSLNVGIYFKMDTPEKEVSIIENEITINGQVEDNQMKYLLKAIISTDGKTVIKDNMLEITSSSKIKIALFLATNYKNEYPKYRGENPLEIIKASIKKYSEDKDSFATSVRDYQRLFNKQHLELIDSNISICADVLLEKYKKSQCTDAEKLQLEELMFAYGKYLIISSSRTGSLPANLQGVWNDSNKPAWGSDYHLNINLQMCYWPVYMIGAFECAIPLLEYVESLRVPGRITAKEYHGIISDENNPENGWVCHNQNTPFGWTCPGWSFFWGWSPAASSWILQNCYEYYQYSQDVETLKKLIYPAMKENVKFWIQNLIYDKAQDKYVSSPSYSPEHGPISQGNTYEQEIIFALFSSTIEAAKILDEDPQFIKDMETIHDRLKPLSIGKWGQIKEWQEEDSWFSSPFFRKFGYSLHGSQFHHRHASHLLGLYPYYDINANTPELFEAAKVSLVDRGDLGASNPGWSKANKSCLYARLKDAEKAYSTLSKLIKNNIYPNLWDYHPPYQMDGNSGYATAVLEMLVYDDGKTIEILPALPTEWQSGSVNGFRLKNGRTADFAWVCGKVVLLRISGKTQKIDIVVNKTQTSIETNQTYNF